MYRSNDVALQQPVFLSRLSKRDTDKLEKVHDKVGMLSEEEKGIMATLVFKATDSWHATIHILRRKKNKGPVDGCCILDTRTNATTGSHFVDTYDDDSVTFYIDDPKYLSCWSRQGCMPCNFGFRAAMRRTGMALDQTGTEYFDHLRFRFIRKEEYHGTAGKIHILAAPEWKSHHNSYATLSSSVTTMAQNIRVKLGFSLLIFHSICLPTITTKNFLISFTPELRTILMKVMTLQRSVTLSNELVDGSWMGLIYGIVSV